MSSYRVISSDSHVMEPPDLWLAWMDPKFGDRIPRVVSEEDGDWWYCDGIKAQSFEAATQAGMRFEEPEKLSWKDTFDKVRLGAYIPEEHVKDMDLDGVDVGMVYPTQGFTLYSWQDSELLTEICRSYTEWVADFSNTVSNRLKGIGILNIDDIDVGIKGLKRCKELGLIGAMITVYPHQERSYDLPLYDPFWAAAQDLQIPLSMHVASNRPALQILDLDEASPGQLMNFDYWVRMSLAQMILSGVFERFPKLVVGSVEHELSWVPYFLDRIDHHYTNAAYKGHRFKNDMLPSDFFHRNVFLGFQQDAKGIRDRHIIGVDNILWGSDYPHQESTFPRSRQILEEILSDCTDEEKAKITGGNAERIYHI